MSNFISHPVFQDMLQLGGSKNQLNAAIAFQVYMDLCEVQVLRDVEYAFNREIDSIYLTARESYSSKNADIFLPLPATFKVELSWIRTVQNTLCSGQDKRSVILALKAQDSTIVYYRMTEGLVPPDSPETARQKKLLGEKRYYVGLELHRKRLELLEKACANQEVVKNSVEESSIQSESLCNSVDVRAGSELQKEQNTSRVEDAAEKENRDAEITVNVEQNSLKMESVKEENGNTEVDSPELIEIASESDASCPY